MEVVSGPEGRPRIHYEAPAAALLSKEMDAFLKWFEGDDDIDKLIRAGLAHLWFVTIHPFDDGNGRIARAIADMALARAEKSAQRFYSMSAQIRIERNDYYDILERTQKAQTLDVTPWLEWFLDCLARAIDGAEKIFKNVLDKAEFWKRHAQAKINIRQRDILNHLLDGFQGKLTSSKYAVIEKCSPDTALRDINELVAMGLLKKDEGGGRSTSYSLTSPNDSDP
jgi:Fic family protein